MKFKTLKRLVVLFMSISIINSTIITMVVIYGYGALLDFVDAPFAMIFPGVLGLLITTIITFVSGDIIIKAYKDSRRNKK